MSRRELGITPANIQGIFRMCGGRAAHNKRRKIQAELRQLELAKMMKELPLFGFKAEAARRLGVHRATIARDLAILARRYRSDLESSKLSRPPVDPRWHHQG